MAIAAYYKWVDAGRPYTVARPIRELVAMAKAAGVPVLGVIGDTSHLTSNNPQDHTPFPVNPWPKPLPGYVVCATDIKYGPWAGRLLQAAKDGRAPWVKYLNFQLKHYDVRTGWVPTANSDTHLHVSCRSDFLNAQVTFNPFVEDDDMASIAEIQSIVERLDGRIAALFYGMKDNPYGAGDMKGEPNALQGTLVDIKGLLENAVAGNGLSDSDRALIVGLTDAVIALNNRLSTP